LRISYLARKTPHAFCAAKSNRQRIRTPHAVRCRGDDAMEESGTDDGTMRRRGHGSMNQVLFILIAVGAGMINALQLSMLGGISRDRGSFAATWISMLASLAGMALLMAVLAFRGLTAFAILAAIMTTSLVLAGRGLPPYLLLTGLTSIPYLLAAAFVGPRIGLGVYFASIVTGQLTGSIFFDQLGAFGAAQRPVDGLRLAGVAFLIVGVVLIRGRQ
jgi:bacterial/archaeal transporter family-2 protein